MDGCEQVHKNKPLPIKALPWKSGICGALDSCNHYFVGLLSSAIRCYRSVSHNAPPRKEQKRLQEDDPGWKEGSDAPLLSPVPCLILSCPLHISLSFCLNLDSPEANHEART